MSDDWTLKDFFNAPCTVLRANSTLNFDLHLQFPISKKIICWIRNGDLVTADHLDKLQKFGQPEILVKHGDVIAYSKYLKGREDSPAPPAAPTTVNMPAPNIGVVRSIFGDTLRAKSKIEIIKGGRPEKSDLVWVKSKKEASTVAARKTVDVDFLNVIIAATQNSIQELCRVEVKSRGPRRRSDSSTPFSIDLASFIGLTTSTIRGTVGLCFPTSTFCYAVSKATGQEITALNPQILPACAEFIQSIYEKACPALDKLGYELDIAVSCFVSGQDLILSHIFSDPGFSLVFESPGGLFQLEIGVKTSG